MNMYHNILKKLEKWNTDIKQIKIDPSNVEYVTSSLKLKKLLKPFLVEHIDKILPLDEEETEEKNAIKTQEQLKVEKHKAKEYNNIADFDKNGRSLHLDSE